MIISNLIDNLYFRIIFYSHSPTPTSKYTIRMRNQNNRFHHAFYFNLTQIFYQVYLIFVIYVFAITYILVFMYRVSRPITLSKHSIAGIFFSTIFTIKYPITPPSVFNIRSSTSHRRYEP